MDIPKILEQLKYLTPGKFPRHALAEAVKQQEAITPDLMAILEYVRDHFDEIYADEAYMAHLYALFLLARFRERRAYPLIVQIFSRSGDEIGDLFGDIITEDLGRILASVSHGDTSLMKTLAENREADIWVRGAALDGLVCLVAEGVKSREEVVAYFKSLFGRYEEESQEVVSCLGGTCLDIYPQEMYEEIRKALEENRIDPFYMTIEELDEVIKEGEEQTLTRLRENRHYRFIEDTIKEMEWWSCFQEPDEPEKTEEEDDFPFASLYDDPDETFREAPIRPKIGRNAPCPCGSGKKYKKCCGV